MTCRLPVAEHLWTCLKTSAGCHYVGELISERHPKIHEVHIIKMNRKKYSVTLTTFYSICRPGGLSANLLCMFILVLEIGKVFKALLAVVVSQSRRATRLRYTRLTSSSDWNGARGFSFVITDPFIYRSLEDRSRLTEQKCAREPNGLKVTGSTFFMRHTSCNDDIRTG